MKSVLETSVYLLIQPSVIGMQFQRALDEVDHHDLIQSEFRLGCNIEMALTAFAMTFGGPRMEQCSCPGFPGCFSGF